MATSTATVLAPAPKHNSKYCARCRYRHLYPGRGVRWVIGCNGVRGSLPLSAAEDAIYFAQKSFRRYGQPVEIYVSENCGETWVLWAIWDSKGETAK